MCWLELDNLCATHSTDTGKPKVSCCHADQLLKKLSSVNYFKSLITLKVRRFLKILLIAIFWYSIVTVVLIFYQDSNQRISNHNLLDFHKIRESIIEANRSFSVVIMFCKTNAKVKTLYLFSAVPFCAIWHHL